MANFYYSRDSLQQSSMKQGTHYSNLQLSKGLNIANFNETKELPLQFLMKKGIPYSILYIVLSRFRPYHDTSLFAISMEITESDKVIWLVYQFDISNRFTKLTSTPSNLFQCLSGNKVKVLTS